MAVIVVNPDGSSNAKAGDTVITGGGIYRKNDDGTSTKIEGLSSFIGKNTTGDYSQLSKIAQSYAARESSRGGSSSNSYVDYGTSSGKEITAASNDTYVAQAVDQNGIISGTTIQGFTPVNYSSGSASSSSGINKIVGYIVLGLVGLAILDRFVSGGGKK